MTRVQFEQLTNGEQIQILRQSAILLAQRTIAGTPVYLYALHSFYIELFEELPAQHPGAIRFLRLFEDLAYLDIYLSELPLPDLLADLNG